MSRPHRILHAESAGSYLTPSAAPKMKLTPAELPLTLTADVLRLPYPLATRVVLAEIISLHAANAGLCDASDAHFAARLTVNKDTVSVAVKLLEKDGLIVKVTTRTPNGLYRTLAPVPATISEKAATNPYPEKPGTRNFPDGYPENPVKGTRKNRVGVPGNSGSNTSTLNIPVEHSIKSSSAAHDAAAERKLEVEVEPAPELAREEVAAEGSDASAPHTGGARPKSKRSRLGKPERTSRPEVPFLESDIGTPEAFAAAFEGTDYALANLGYYFEKITAWRQKGEVPRRKDWKATAKQFFLNDISSNSLVLAPGVQHAAAAGGPDSGARPTGSGYRSKYDQ